MPERICPNPCFDRGKPILWHIMKIYAAAGLRDFILAWGIKAGSLKIFINYDARLCDTVVESAHGGA